LEDLNNIVEDEGNLNPEKNSEHFLAIIIECLALLNQIPEAIEVYINISIFFIKNPIHKLISSLMYFKIIIN
jgi:hypothetical protein